MEENKTGISIVDPAKCASCKPGKETKIETETGKICACRIFEELVPRE